MQKRKNYLIYKEFQLKMILFNFVTTAVCFSIFVFLILNSFDSVSAVLAKAGIPDQHPIFKFISFQKSALFTRVAILSAVFTVTMMLFNLFLSHRISGPIVRLIDFLKEVKSGENHSKLKFRENDFFKELSTEVNEVLEKNSIISKDSDSKEKASA